MVSYTKHKTTTRSTIYYLQGEDNNMTDDMEKQLQKLGRSINDATREACEVMVSSNGTIVGDIFANKEI